MEVRENQKHIVQSLIGRGQLPFYLRCLKSLLVFCQDRIDLKLYTDGPFSQIDKDCIHKELDGTMVTIIDSSENRSRVLDYLQGRPNCQKVRKDSIWGIEFFDPIFAFPDDPISFTKKTLLYRCTRSYQMMRLNILFQQFKTGSEKRTRWR